MTADSLDPPATRSDVDRVVNSLGNQAGNVGAAHKRLDGHVIHVGLLWFAVAILFLLVLTA